MSTSTEYDLLDATLAALESDVAATLADVRAVTT